MGVGWTQLRRIAIIAAVGSTLCVATSASSYGPLSRIDPSDWDSIVEIELRGDLAVLFDAGDDGDDGELDEEIELAGPRLRVVDIADSRRPTELDTFEVGKRERGASMSFAGSRLYVTTQKRRGGILRVFDLSDSGRIDPVHQVALSTTPLAIVVDGGRAFLTTSSDDTDAGLHVLDVSGGREPKEIGFVALPGGGHGLAVAGGLVYVSVGSRSLAVVDVSAGDDPRIVATAGGAGSGISHIDLELGGERVYLTDRRNTRVFDVSDSRAPTFEGILDASEGARDLEIEGDRLFLTRAPLTPPIACT